MGAKGLGKYRMTTLPTKAKTRAERERDQWEERALAVFRRAYAAQRGRILPVLLEADRADMERLINEMFQGEDARMAEAMQPFFDRLANDVAQAALLEAGVSADPDSLMLTINQLVDETATIFGRVTTENGRRLTLSIVRDSLDGETDLGTLTRRLERVWRGPRPQAAAVTETTRLVSRSRVNAWQASGVIWGYNVRTRNDDKVRPEHTRVAEQGPYPINDTAHLPPINGDVNCRCFTSPVVEDPNG